MEMLGEATRDRLVRAAAAAGWRTSSGSAERDGPLELLRLAFEPGVRTVIAGTLDPPGGAERSRLGLLAGLLAAGISAVAGRKRLEIASVAVVGMSERAGGANAPVARTRAGSLRSASATRSASHR